MQRLDIGPACPVREQRVAHDSVRRVVRRALVVLAVGGLAWSGLIAVTGGVSGDIGGLHVSSRNPRQPALIGALALALYQLLGGVVRLPGAVRTVLRRSTRRGRAIPDGVGRLIGRLSPRTVAAALALITVAWTASFASTVGGGSDSYGYVSQARLWREGRLVQDQSWALEAPWPEGDSTFSPLGYRPSPDRTAIVPIYAPGLPMVMAAAQAVAGHCAAFWISPLSAGLIVWLTFVLGLRLTTAWAAVGASWLMATSPTLGYMAVQPMSDVPVTAAWLASFVLLLRWTTGSALGAGLVASLAILIRPNLVVLAAAPGALLLWEVARGRPGSPGWRCLVAWSVGVLPGVCGIFAINAWFYGDPIRSGYGGLDALFAIENVGTNVRQYTTWVLQAEHAVVLPGLALLFLPLRQAWPRAPASVVAALAAFCGLLIAEYLLYIPFDAWWYLRFLLPAAPFVMVAASHLVLSVLGGHRRFLPVAAVIVAASGLYALRPEYRESTLSLWRSEQRYVSVANHVRAVTPEGSVILTLQHSGSLRYYGGRLTMRYEWLDRDQLDVAVAWLEKQGAHPYALLDAWELPEFRKRFAGQAALASLEAGPRLHYRGADEVFLFDLAPAGPRPDEAVSVVEGHSRAGCQPPAPDPPVVSWRPDSDSRRPAGR